MIKPINMKKIKCVVVNNENFDNISRNLEDKLEIYNLQTYFPILSFSLNFIIILINNLH